MATPQRNGPTLSTRRRWLFAALLLVLVWAVAEAGAFAAFWVLDGQPFSAARLRERQRAVIAAGGVRDGVEESGDGERAIFPGLAHEATDAQVVHPYQGFVYDGEAEWGGTRVSSWGFRDARPPLHRRGPERLIVAITGGSFAMHFAEEGGRRLATRLAKSERHRGRDVTIVNLAISGYKQPQQLATLAYLLSVGAEFDLVLNLDGFNEVALHGPENLQQGVHPAFPRAWFLRTLRLPDPRTHARLGEIRYLRDRRARLAQDLLRSPLRHSLVANLVWNAGDRRLAGRLSTVQSAVRASESGGGFQNTGPPFEYTEEGELFETLAAIWARSSLQMHALAEASGSAYHHFLQPNQHVGDGKPMGAAERRVAFGKLDRYAGGARKGYPLLRREGRRIAAAGVRFRDLGDVFDDTPEAVYRDACCHVNRRGNDILADAIAAAVLEAP